MQRFEGQSSRNSVYVPCFIANLSMYRRVRTALDLTRRYKHAPLSHILPSSEVAWLPSATGGHSERNAGLLADTFPISLNLLHLPTMHPRLKKSCRPPRRVSTAAQLNTLPLHVTCYAYCPLKLAQIGVSRMSSDSWHQTGPGACAVVHHAKNLEFQVGYGGLIRLALFTDTTDRTSTNIRGRYDIDICEITSIYCSGLSLLACSDLDYIVYSPHPRRLRILHISTTVS
jgi:hypothetical protein